MGGAGLSGCGSGDSTVSKTPLSAQPALAPTSLHASPEPSVEPSAQPSHQPAAPDPAVKTPTATQTRTTAPAARPEPAAPPSAAADPCAVTLTAPVIAQAVSTLPRDPRSNQEWSPEPLAGNFNECSPLSAVIVKANTNSARPNTRAVLFHRGQYIAAGVPDTFGFDGIDIAQSTPDTVALTYTITTSPGTSTTNPGTTLISVVKFRWNGQGVELIGNTET